jgi:bacterial/archaeal transporter family-2 protein
MATLTVLVTLALLAGACLPTQAGINARLNLWTGDPVLAAMISFAVGTLALIGYSLLLRIPFPDPASASREPWWIWTGGFLGAFFVASTVILAPRLGATSMVALILAGQMAASMACDHYGVLGYSVHPVSAMRIAGVLLVTVGVLLIQRT